MPHTVKSAKEAADGTVIDSISGVIKDVKEPRTVNGARGQTVVINFTLVDGNDKIYGSAWDFPIHEHVDEIVTLCSGKGGNGRFGGVTIKEDSWTDKEGKPRTSKKLSIDSRCRVTTPELEIGIKSAGGKPLVEQAAKGLEQSSQQIRQVPKTETHEAPKPHVVQPPSVINGQTVGMSVKCACDWLMNAGIDITAEKIWPIASEIIRVSQRLERGQLFPEPAHLANEHIPTKEPKALGQTIADIRQSYKPGTEDDVPF